jgi:hypothetical protein
MLFLVYFSTLFLNVLNLLNDLDLHQIHITISNMVINDKNMYIHLRHKSLLVHIHLYILDLIIH